MDKNPAKEADTPALRRKKRYKQLLVILFVIFNIAIIFWTARKEFSRDQGLASSGINLPWWLLIPAILSFAAAVFAEFTKYNLLLERFTKKKDFSLARQTVTIGRYYDNITPAAVGGQPFQILHMKKHGVPGEYAAMVPIIGFVSTQLAFVALALLMFVFGPRFVISDVAYAASYIGLMFYAFLPVLILLFVFAPKTMHRLVSGVLKFLHKIRIVRNLEAAEEKTFGEMEKYVRCIKSVIHDRKLLGKIMGLSFVYQLGMNSIPFFVITAFGGGIGYLEATFTTIAINAAISFIPTPGNAGAAEGSFFLVFETLSSGSTFWAMLTWRFFSYYAFIIGGALTYLELGIKKRSRGLRAGTRENSTN
ncbi:flippase-like domain-containing protein [Candidatus Saccharibacteria bacterium]|nr:flippase-like domain-containing protein [Candidatus Saccharibacteria bacterium]